MTATCTVYTPQSPHRTDAARRAEIAAAYADGTVDMWARINRGPASQPAR